MLVRLPVRRLSPTGDGRSVQDDGGGVLSEAPPAGEQERPVRLEGRETPGAEGGQRRTVGRDREQQATGNRQQATGNGQQATGNGQRATGNGQQAPGNRQSRRAGSNSHQPPATAHRPRTADLRPRTAPFAQKKVGETLLAQGSVIALRLGRGPSSSEARFAKLPRRRVGSIPVGAHLHRSSLRRL